VSVQKIASYVSLTIKTNMVGQINISRQQHPKYKAMIHLLASHAKVVAKGPTKRSANLLNRPNLARLRPDALAGSLPPPTGSRCPSVSMYIVASTALEVAFKVERSLIL